MINTWWFQLYTKKSIMWAGVTLVGLVLLDLILPKDNALMLLLGGMGVLGWTVTKIYRNCTLARDNYYFYLNTFSIQEVLRFYFLNTTISFTALFVSMIVAAFVTQFTGGVIGGGFE